MSQYLEMSETEYVSTGTTLTTNLIIRASAIIDGFCKRKISVEPYTERVPLNEHQRGHLSYYPVLEITSLKGRPLYGISGNDFFGPPQFEEIADLSVLDVDKNIGTLWCGCSLFGAPYAELEVTYKSGWSVIPDTVKVACGMIIDQLNASNNSNVKSKKDFDSSIEYFGNKLVTPEIGDMLSIFVQISFR